MSSKIAYKEKLSVPVIQVLCYSQVFINAVNAVNNAVKVLLVILFT